MFTKAMGVFSLEIIILVPESIDFLFCICNDCFKSLYFWLVLRVKVIGGSLFLEFEGGSIYLVLKLAYQIVFVLDFVF